MVTSYFPFNTRAMIASFAYYVEQANGIPISCFVAALTSSYSPTLIFLLRGAELRGSGGRSWICRTTSRRACQPTLLKPTRRSTTRTRAAWLTLLLPGMMTLRRGRLPALKLMTLEQPNRRTRVLSHRLLVKLVSGLSAMALTSNCSSIFIRHVTSFRRQRLVLSAVASSEAMTLKIHFC